ALVAVLQRQAVLDRADVVAEVQPGGRRVARQQAGLVVHATTVHRGAGLARGARMTTLPRSLFRGRSAGGPPASPSRDLPWLADPLRELLRLSWPVTVSMMSLTVMTLIDAIMVGRLGKDALGGFGLGGTVAFTLVSFGWGLARGGKTLVSQAIGA